MTTSALADAIEALEKCQNQFLFYEQQHLAKHTADADAKAKANRAMVGVCQEALASLKVPEGEGFEVATRLRAGLAEMAVAAVVPMDLWNLFSSDVLEAAALLALAPQAAGGEDLGRCSAGGEVGERANGPSPAGGVSELSAGELDRLERLRTDAVLAGITAPIGRGVPVEMTAYFDALDGLAERLIAQARRALSAVPPASAPSAVWQKSGGAE